MRFVSNSNVSTSVFSVKIFRNINIKRVNRDDGTVKQELQCLLLEITRALK